MKKIVIVGSGFAGVNAALELNRLVGKDEAEITLVDKNPYHLAHTYLYEVAASPEELTSLGQLKQSVAVPIAEILKGTHVRFHQGAVIKVDSEKQVIQLEHGELSYDYLVLALGSESNFYGIPGAAEHSISLKSVKDSFAIRNKIEFMIQAHRQDMTKQLLRIVIAGGGFAGVEMAAELRGLLDFLSWKNNYPREKLEVLVVEGTNQLMPGLGESVGKDVYARLKSLGMQIRLNSMITKVDEKFLEFNNGEKLEHDCLIWTAGVKARQVPFTTELEFDRGGRLMTDTVFRSTKVQNVFSVGDQACFMDPASSRPLPTTARQAIYQGRYVAYALSEILKNRQPQPHVCKTFGYIVPLGGKWAIFKTPRFYMKGFLPYLARQMAWFHYFYQILGLSRALQLSVLQNRLYGRND